jgi:hypothetical protein
MRDGPLQIEELTTEVSDGVRMLRQVMTVENSGGRALADTTWYRYATLEPIAHRSHAAQRTLVLDYQSREVLGYEESGRERTPINVPLAKPVFDPSSSILALRALPLHVGMEVRTPLFDHAAHAERWSRVRVAGVDTVAVGAAAVPAWRLTVQISSERPDVTYWIAQRNHRLLEVEAPIGGGRVMLGAVTPLPSPEDVIDRGIAALGGETALRSVRSVSATEIGNQYLIEQSERPAGPWIAMYEDRATLIDLENRTTRVSTRTRFMQFPDWTPARTMVADTGAAAFVRGDRQAPGGYPNVLEASWTLELDPLRLWFAARDAADERIVGDTVVQSVPHTILAFTWRERPVRVLVNVHTSLPTAVAVRAPELHGHGSVWGDAWVSTWFSAWALEDGSVRFPRQRDVYFEHYPWKSVTATRVAFNVEAPADSFAITPDTRRAFVAAQDAGGLRDMQLGRTFGGAHAEPIELPGGIVVLPGAWYATLVPVDDGLVVLEAPISPEYSEQVMEEAQRRFPDREITAAISTSDAWPHVGGVRGYVARGIPVYTVDVNQPLLERIVAQPWTAAPDALERDLKTAEFEPVSGKTTLGQGDDALELYPIRSESGERMLMAYWPAHRLLYAADLIQQQRDGSFFWPLYLQEVVDAVRREGLDVETVFAMHTSPTPWSRILEAVQ